MSYFHTCPNCGANLDPGEICDCKRNAAPSVNGTESGRRKSEFDRRCFRLHYIRKTEANQE